MWIYELLGGKVAGSPLFPPVRLSTHASLYGLLYDTHWPPHSHPSPLNSPHARSQSSPTALMQSDSRVKLAARSITRQLSTDPPRCTGQTSIVYDSTDPVWPAEETICVDPLRLRNGRICVDIRDDWPSASHTLCLPSACFGTAGRALSPLTRLVPSRSGIPTAPQLQLRQAAPHFWRP